MSAGRPLEAALWALALALFGAGWLLAPPPVPGFTPGPRPDDCVRIVTWNVGGARDGVTHGLRPEDVDAVARTLRQLDPDLALLQEVAASRLADLRASLGEGWSVVPGRGDTVALSARQRLSRWRHPRGPANVVGVELELGGRTWRVLGLHASAFSARARNEEIGAAAAALQADPGDVSVLAGDLNLDADPGQRGELFSDDEHLDVETYNFALRGLTDAARAAGPTAEPDRRLDYVLVSPNATPVAAGPWKGQRVGSMDHDPVVADLR